MKEPVNFTRDPAAGEILRGWWISLQNRRADRADLCRCRGESDVALVPSFYRLVSALREPGYNPSLHRLATVAGVLAHVRRDADDAMGRAMSRSHGAGPVLSEARFRRLLAAEDRQDLYSQLVRCVRLLGNSAPLLDLANAAYWWNEAVRKRWAYDYYSDVRS
jgi:CRISPR system Cascade subunit CasB